MANHFFPLPKKPDFSVFGLGPDFDGYRWLVLWNTDDYLYTVTLGHGQPESGVWIAVTTVFKTPERVIRDEPLISVGPTGYADAVTDAVMRLAGLGHPNDPAAQRALIERESGEVGPEADEFSLSANSQVDTIVIDDHQHLCRSYELNGVRAMLIDLSDVAIAVTGSADSERTPLVNVVDQLDSYV